MLLGLEEEVFVTNVERPTLHSLYYLARLLWKNPSVYYVHTDSNFARGEDIRQGLMGGIEISTRPHAAVSSLLEELARSRALLAEICTDGLLVPLGHLINFDAPTITCGLHVHISGLDDPQRAYRNLAHFLPLLALMTANSPYCRGIYFGPSYRMARGYAIGPLRASPTYRFQDIIFSRRLGTIELRVFDPVWDLARLRYLLEAVRAIARSEKGYPLDRNLYNRQRWRVAREGYGGSLKALYRELGELCYVPEELFVRTPAEEVRRCYEVYGLLGTYSALDNAYRNGIFEPRPIPAFNPSLSKQAVGLAAYYMVKLPYKLKKVWQEW